MSLSAKEIRRLVEAGQPLSEQEVAERRLRFGPNVLVPESRQSIRVWIVRFFLDPMVVLLSAAGITYAVLGARLDAAIAFGALVPIFLVTAILERRSERALQELKKIALPTARVRRGLHDIIIDARDVVPGDLLLVQAGDVFVADGVLISITALVVDESALTGESQPVVKKPGSAEVLAGTAVRSGRGEVIVTAIGSATKYGRIGTVMSEMHVSATPIERVLWRLVQRVGIAVVMLCAIVIVVERFHGAVWPAAIIAGVSLAMAGIPEELPMVYIFYLAMGAWRLSKVRVRVRRLVGVERLGSVTVVCVNKTGTLTMGEQEVSTLWTTPKTPELELVSAAVLACDSGSFDPLDRAILRFAPSKGIDAAILDRAIAKIRYPFDAAHRRITQVWSEPAGVRVVTKGALETILELCDVTDDERALIMRQNEALAGRGMRVIAVAQKYPALSDENRAQDEAHLRCLGLVAFSDPVRPDVPAAIAACARAGIAVMMITGDHPATAEAAADGLGLVHGTRTLTGPELEAMPDSDLIRVLPDVRIVARITPEQKLRIVKMFQARGDSVAITGRDTNDAQALREADLGVAMGMQGTDVARTAADLVLLDDNFATFVAALAGGRRVFRNVRRAFRYLTAFHAPLIISAVVIPFVGVPLLLLPIELVLLELVVHSTSALVYENDPGEAEDLMTQPPRSKSGPLRVQDWLRPIALGVVLAAACVAIYLFDLDHGYPVEAARGMALATMVMGQLLLVLTERSTRLPVWKQSLTDNSRLLPILGGTLAMMLVALYVPPLAVALRVAPPSTVRLVEALCIAAVCTLWLEPFKRIARS